MSNFLCQNEYFGPLVSKFVSLILSLFCLEGTFPLVETQLVQLTLVSELKFQAMSRRQELVFHQEFKFRNKLLEYLTDWIMHSSEEEKHIPLDLTVRSK